VGPMPIAMIGVLAEDSLQVATSPDHHPMTGCRRQVDPNVPDTSLYTVHDRPIQILRTLSRTCAPILKSFRRIVPHCAPALAGSR
jgi:hypothetical protein